MPNSLEEVVLKQLGANQFVRKKAQADGTRTWERTLAFAKNRCARAQNELPNETSIAAVQEIIDALTASRDRLNKMKALEVYMVGKEDSVTIAKCEEVLAIAENKKTQLQADMRNKNWVSAFKAFEEFCGNARANISNEGTIDGVKKLIACLNQTRSEAEESAKYFPDRIVGHFVFTGRG